MKVEFCLSLVMVKYHRCNYAGQIFKLFQITTVGSVSREGCYFHRKRSLTGVNHWSFAIKGLGGIFLVSARLGNM